ncbi:MAG: HPr family phosphocarrier protein [Planctomycetes bacterium]|nr:HPr family phosphocarrier protein [Planctomycetota bacterium]
MELERKVQLTHILGLHVRVSVKLVEEARKFKSDIFLSTEKDTVNGKDIMSVLTLGAGPGTHLVLRAVGEDAQAALDHLEALFLADFQT